jgi:hypothetical protein
MPASKPNGNEPRHLQGASLNQIGNGGSSWTGIWGNPTLGSFGSTNNESTRGGRLLLSLLFITMADSVQKKVIT